MQIIGEIKEVVYRNLENGYTVIKILCHGDIVVATGKFPIVGEGECVKLDGEYKLNPRFGNQFVADSIVVSRPSSREQMEKYLCSGLISGVGPVTARAIVNKFGEDTFDVIESTPTKLAEIKGISLKKSLEIYKSFSDIQNMQNAVMFLQKYDISINLAVKIYTKYKNQTELVMNTNPYKLLEDIDGVGFKTADKIAMKLGIDVDSPFRIRAGMLYVLSELSIRLGSTMMKKDELFYETAHILEMDEREGVFEDEIDKLEIDALIKKIDIDGEIYIENANNYNLEKTIATRLTMLGTFGEKIKLDVSQDIRDYEQRNKIELSDGQKEAIQTAVSNPVVVLTGGPGTGKTTIVKNVLQILKNMRKKCMLLAPTGRAAKRMEEATGEPASTIHRALEVDFNGQSRSFKYDEENPLEIDVAIVDEASMLDVYVMASLVRALSLGTKLILVGDKDQLPSVGAGNVLADIISSDRFPVVELKHIYRQAEDSKIIVNAHKVNAGEMIDLKEKSKDFFFIENTNPESASELIVGLVQNRLPNYLNIEPDRVQVISPMKAGLCGVENINQLLQNHINPASPEKDEIEYAKRIFRVGDRVMQTSNNYDQEWIKENERGYSYIGKGVFNGDMGIIKDISSMTHEVVVQFEDGRECNYSLAELDELVLSYAITVHKSQGSEFDAVVIPIFGGNPVLYNKNLLYTALTRAKKLVVIVGNPKNVYGMIKNKMINRRMTMLKRFILESDNTTK